MYKFICTSPIYNNSINNEYTFIFDTEDKFFDVSSINFTLLNSSLPISSLYNSLSQITLYLNDKVRNFVYYPQVFKDSNIYSFMSERRFKGVIKIKIQRNSIQFPQFKGLIIYISDSDSVDFQSDEGNDSRILREQYKIPLINLSFNNSHFENDYLDEIDKTKNVNGFYPVQLMELPKTKGVRTLKIMKSDDYVKISTFTNSLEDIFYKEGDTFEITNPDTNYLIIRDTLSLNPGMKDKFIYIDVIYT